MGWRYAGIGALWGGTWCGVIGGIWGAVDGSGFAWTFGTIETGLIRTVLGALAGFAIGAIAIGAVFRRFGNAYANAIEDDSAHADGTAR